MMSLGSGSSGDLVVYSICVGLGVAGTGGHDYDAVEQIMDCCADSADTLRYIMCRIVRRGFRRRLLCDGSHSVMKSIPFHSNI